MPALLFNNPYHNIASLPPQPVSSVVGNQVMFNAYNETGGLHSGYNYVDFQNKFHEHKMMQDAHRNAYFPDPLQYESRDPSNVLPQLMPLYYTERPNFSYLNNPAPVNPNYDMRSERTSVPPGFLTATEGYPTVSPIMVGLANSQLSIGPARFN
jgi:hypothetical protein